MRNFQYFVLIEQNKNNKFGRSYLPPECLRIQGMVNILGQKIHENRRMKETNSLGS